MDGSFVVLSLLRDAAAAGAQGDVDEAVRLDRAFDGESGEGYLLRFDDRLCFAERRTGETDYTCFVLPLTEIALCALSEDHFLTRARFRAGDRFFDCCWSWAEREDAEKLLLQFRNETNLASDTENSGAETGTCSPAVLFVAGLMFAAGADNNLPEEEEQKIRELAPEEALKPGVAFYQQSSLEDFAAAARHALSDKQLISLLSNQLEILMADGEFSSTERRMMSELVRLLQFPPEDYARIEKVILLKNQRNGLFAS